MLLMVFKKWLRLRLRLKISELLKTVAVTEQSWNAWKRPNKLQRQDIDGMNCWEMQDGVGSRTQKESRGNMLFLRKRKEGEVS